MCVWAGDGGPKETRPTDALRLRCGQALHVEEPWTHSHAPHIMHSHTYEDSDFSETYNLLPTNHSLIVGPTASVKRALPAGAGLRARLRCVSDEGLFSNWTAWSR
jgi:hypothetical protein